MPENPWLEGGKGGGPEEKSKEGSEVGEEERDNVSQDAPQHPLFADESDVDVADGAAAADDIFTAEDEIPDSEKVEPEGAKEPLMRVSTFKKRIGAIIRQRQDAKREAQQYRVAASKAEGERDAIKDIMAEFREEYKGNPKLAAWDSKFMSTLERMAKADPQLAQLATKVEEQMEGAGGVVKGSEISMDDLKNSKSNAEKNLSQETDSRLQALIEGQARTTIKDSLEGIKPGFVEILADHIVATSEKLEGITSADVIRLSRDYIAEKGIDKGDVVIAKPKPKDDGDSDTDPGDADAGKAGGKKKPATGGGSGKAASPKGKKGEGAGQDDGRPEPAKNLDEWEANRAKRTRAFFEEADAQ